MNDEQKNKILEIRNAFQVYTNSTPIASIDGVDITVLDVVTASLIARLNMFFIGRPGWGKSQLGEDVKRGILGDSATYIKGRHDLDLKTVFERLNLSKIRQARTEDEIREITENVGKILFFIDEINRAPPLIQNTLFGLMEGNISINGRKYELGKHNYSIGLATGNLGDGTYTGTFTMDDALTERLHVILDVSSLFKPNSIDLFDIFCSTDNPRVKEFNTKDMFNSLLEVHNEFKQKPFDLFYVIMKLYLTEGLNWCSLETAKNSKAVLGKNFASILKSNGQTHELATLTGTSSSMSPRTAFVVSALANALEMVTKAKGAENNLTIDSSIAAVKIIAPYQNIFDSQVVRNNYYGNFNLAAEEFGKEITTEISNKLEPLAYAFKQATEGNLNTKDLEEFRDKWKFMQGILRKLNTTTVENNQLRKNNKANLNLKGVNNE